MAPISPSSSKRALRRPKVALSHQVGQSGPPILLGKALSAEELLPGDYRLPASLQANGWGALLADMQFNLGMRDGHDGFSNVKAGVYDEWSLMFMPLEVENLRGLPVDGERRVSGDHLQNVTAIRDIVEFSPVVMGANPATLTVGAKGLPRAQRMPTRLELAISQMAVDAGQVAAAKALHGSWWESHVDPDVLERVGR